MRVVCCRLFAVERPNFSASINLKIQYVFYEGQMYQKNVFKVSQIFCVMGFGAPENAYYGYMAVFEA